MSSTDAKMAHRRGGLPEHERIEDAASRWKSMPGARPPTHAAAAQHVELPLEALQAINAAATEEGRWEHVGRRLPSVRQSCDDVLTGCDEVARKLEECLGFAKAAPPRRHV